MNLEEVTEEELIAELEKRAQPQEESDLVVGTLCHYAEEGPSVEAFIKVKKPDDLPIGSMRIRARFNSHRNYKLFYFKTDVFEELKDNADKDPRKFAQWVLNTDSITMVRL